MKFTTPPSPPVLDNLFSKWSNHSTMQRINPIHVVHVWEKYDDSIIVVYANKELSFLGLACAKVFISSIFIFTRDHFCDACLSVFKINVL